MGLRLSWGIVLLVAMMVAMGWVDSVFAYLNGLPDVQRNLAIGFILSGFGTLGVGSWWIATRLWRWFWPKSRYKEWMDLANRFYRLADEDNKVFPAGTPVPSGVLKVNASRVFGKWRLTDGTEPHIRHEAESLSRMAGKLLRKSSVKHKRVWPWSDPVQDWIAFVASLSIGERGEEFRRLNDKGETVETTITLEVVVFTFFLAAKHCASFETIPVGE